MALVNHAKKEINAKIVYFGPAGCGKSTALNYIYSRIKPSLRGELKSIPAGSDNLLFFDFSPFEAPLPNGYRIRLHIYTLTGAVTNPATWKMTLKGTDGIIIMVNPADERSAETRESISQLRDFLSAYGVGLHDTPSVLQLNSFSKEQQPRGFETALSLDLPSLTTCNCNAASGTGLLEAMTTLSRLVLDKVTANIEPFEEIIGDNSQSAETESSEVYHQDLSPPTIDAHSDSSIQVSLLTHEVASENGSIRIPLTITHGDSFRRVVVTLKIDVE